MSKTTKDTISRRGLLIKLGLATGAAYVAPTFAGMDVAKASTGSTASAPSAPSAPSGPSAPSTPSMPSGASVPSRPSDASGQPAFQWRWDPETWTWVQVVPAQ